jgi:hypothetical protein
MTHNTELHKQYDDIEAILNVGRTNDDEIYVDVRVYRQGDVIEVGDITLTQAEWNRINDNLKQPAQKLFICPECGDIVTEDDILESLTNGGFGMCLCMFGNGQRTLIRYEPYNPEELVPPITPGEKELIKIIRRLNKEM